MPGHSLSSKKYILRFQRPGEIGFADDPGHHVPVERTDRGGCPARLRHPVAVAIVHVVVTGSTANPIFLVIIVKITQPIIRQITRRVISVSGTVNLIMIVYQNLKILTGT